MNVESLMVLTLCDDDVQTLRELLHGYVPELRYEVARTDATKLRHVLVTRQKPCERMTNQLRGECAITERRRNAARSSTNEAWGLQKGQ